MEKKETAHAKRGTLEEFDLTWVTHYHETMCCGLCIDEQRRVRFASFIDPITGVRTFKSHYEGWRCGRHKTTDAWIAPRARVASRTNRAKKHATSVSARQGGLLTNEVKLATPLSPSVLQELRECFHCSDPFDRLCTSTMATTVCYGSSPVGWRQFPASWKLACDICRKDMTRKTGNVHDVSISLCIIIIIKRRATWLYKENNYNVIAPSLSTAGY